MFTAGRHSGAILRMVLAVAVFACMDAGLKGLAPHYPPFEIVALRSWASLPFLTALLLFSKVNIFVVKGRWVYAFRSLMSLLMVATFIYSVGRQGLTDAYAVFMSAPLLVAALSIVVLKENISVRRWISILVGLIGVLLALKPGGEQLISIAGLAALATAIFYSVNVLSIRALHPDDPAEAVVFWNIMGMAVMATIIAGPHWVPVRLDDALLIALVGTTGAVAQHFLTLAFRMAPASVIAPFEYTALLWGALIDLTIFKQSPSLQVLIGAVVVTAAGLGVMTENPSLPTARPEESEASQPLP
jgi:drug/metabolite transporter (DMT)-like permease